MKTAKTSLLFVAVLGLLALCGSARAADGMVSYWRFDEESGTTAYDSVGANDGTLINGPFWTTGQVDGALSFDGVDDYVDCGSDSSLSFSNTVPLTLEAWVYNNLDIPEYGPPSSETFRIILERSTAWANGYAFQYCYYSGYGYPGYMVWAGFYSGREGFTNYQILANQWYHLAAVYNGTDWVIYINGVAQTTTNIGSGSGVVSTTLLIGKSKPDSTRLHNGIIDEVRIWDEALTCICTGIVDIDIKPGSYPNSINPKAGGVIPVAILTTEDFDASTVDPVTVALEGAGARGKGKSGRYGSMEDVDGDGDLDLVVQIENVIEWDTDATEATLTGETYDGIAIQGTDTVNIVPPEE